MIMNILCAQINFSLGDVEHNTQRILDICESAREQQAHVVIFPELTLTGYPPEDLLLRPQLHRRIAQAKSRLARTITDLTVVVGYPEQTETGLYNSLGILHQGRWIETYRKQCLPNYNVFDEKRYFQAGETPCVVELYGLKMGFLICEDLWERHPLAACKAAGAELILSMHASPYHYQKAQMRQDNLQQRCEEQALPIVSCHWVGAQDELVFDGGSSALQSDGRSCAQATYFAETLLPITAQKITNSVQLSSRYSSPEQTALEHLYQALVLGLRDYVNKNNFPGVLVGSSGGIDSALTLVIAVDALGASRVSSVMMPSPFTAEISRVDAAQLANNLHIDHRELSIGALHETFLAALSPLAGDLRNHLASENLQARIRGTLLMALSNHSGDLVISTSNKSETAVGYATLYGDMVGGFCALKDVLKTQVYDLAQHRNQRDAVIPCRIIERPPSAELSFDQKDSDSLPDYPILDDILRRFVEWDESVADIIAAGHESEVVKKVARLVKLNEYKRRQAPLGSKVSPRAFGRDRRYPITSGFISGA